MMGNLSNIDLYWEISVYSVQQPKEVNPKRDDIKGFESWKGGISQNHLGATRNCVPT